MFGVLQAARAIAAAGPRPGGRGRALRRPLGAPRLPRPRHRRRRRHPVEPAARLPCPPTGGAAFDQLLLGAAAIFLVSFAAGIVTARSFGERGGYPVDADREMVGFGAANIAAGLFSAFPITASDSRTAINASVGGRSQLASVVAAAALLLIVLYLQPALAILPIPALGAILIAAALSLIDIPALRADLADQPHGVRLRDDRALRADQPRGAERRARRHRRDLRLPAAQDDVPARRAARPRPGPRRLLQAAPPRRRPAGPGPRHRADPGRPAVLQRRPRPGPAARHRRRDAARTPAG